jgi:hypothetical protein
VLAVAGVIGSAVYAAVDARQAGMAWRDHATALEGDVARLEDANAGLERALEETQDLLHLSERDVEALEERVSGMASEKAKVEDEREKLVVARDRITEVTEAYDAVAERFSICREQQGVLVGMALEFETYYYSGRLFVIDRQIEIVGRECGAAEVMLATLRDYVDALSGHGG